MASKLLTALLLLCAAECVASHGAMVHPRSRNSVDAFDALAEKKPLPVTFAASNLCVNVSGGSCANGQSAFWYSQGCFIGCPECDHVSGRRQTDVCKLGFVGQLPSEAIAVNRAFPNGTAVPRDSIYDIYRHNPWRAPGHAPVADPCGLAGGTPWLEPSPEEGRYYSTSFASHGMKGTELKPLPLDVYQPEKWKIGGTAEVSWNVWANHGGGYSYRLCPASAPLTEACFQKHPLDFVLDKQQLLLLNGSRIPVPKPVFVNSGTSPAGSMWSRMPIPGGGYGHRCACDLTNDDHGDHPQDFTCGCKMGEQVGSCVTPGNCSSGACLPCPETAGSDCSRCDNPPRNPAHPGYSFEPPCDAECMGQRPGVLDELRVPATLRPGAYVLGFRWDCDASSQVWQQCSDIELVQ